MLITPQTGSSLVASYAAVTALASSMQLGEVWTLATTTAAWVRQGTAKLITCVTKANLADTDFMTITTPAEGTKVYEFDVAGDGVTAGRVQVNVSSDTTAAQVAARLATAIGANQPSLRVTNPADGTLTVDLADTRNLTVTENVTNAGFTIGAGVVQATVAAGSMYVPAGVVVPLRGEFGAQVSVIQDTSAGKAILTRGFTF